MANASRPQPVGTIETTVADGIGWIVYTNPARRNAMSMHMQQRIPEVLASFEADPDVSVVVMRGAGDLAFVSGADISEFGERRTSAEARAEYDEVGSKMRQAWDKFPKPVVAMITGYCLGGGVNAALEADIRIAASNAQFAVPAARLGLGYGYESVRRLTNLVGPSWAAEILFSARRFSAEEALRMGLVNRVVPLDELESAVTQLAQTMAANAPLTVRACKAAIRETQQALGRGNGAQVADLVDACFRSEDYREGQRAFLEKRPPRFVGR